MNLGDNGPLPVGGDQFAVDNSVNTDNDIKTDWGVNGVDLNGDGNLDVALVGVEKASDTVGPGTPSATAKTTGDTVNAGGSTITGAAFPTDITIDGASSVTTYVTSPAAPATTRSPAVAPATTRSLAGSATTASTAVPAMAPWTTRAPRPRSWWI